MKIERENKSQSSCGCVIELKGSQHFYVIVIVALLVVHGFKK
jgi:hypothetical protein